GLAAVALHPGIMHLSEFLAIGTQIATELPGKASVCSACSTIAPPVILLKNGDVVEVDTKEEATRHKKNIKKYLSMGDMLVPFGEFVSNNHVLLPSSYVEEWWVQDVAAAEKSKGIAPRKEAFMEKPYPAPSFEDALAISKQLGVPLHPRYNFFWHDATINDICALIEWFSNAKVSEDKLILPNAPEKELLENLCVPHSVQDEHVVLEAFAKPIYFTLGKPTPANKEALIKVVRGFENTLQAVSALIGVTIQAHGLTRVGVKMGRPEKAERRLLKGRPQVLFPCGPEGGRMRNLMETYKAGSTSAALYTAWCPSCKKEVNNISCPFCRTKTITRKYCTICGKETKGATHCGDRPTRHYKRAKVDVRALMDLAAKRTGVSQMPKIVKGVRGVFGVDRHAEPLEKGFLRAQHDLYVNKDGTTRFDMTDMSLTHFRPREVGTSVSRLRELGYLLDINGASLENEEQVLGLRPQDIIISDNAEFSGAEYLLHIAQFIDSLLERYYGLAPYYNMNTKKDIIGVLVIGLAPHTSAGIIGRIIGFTPAKICYAHPFWHAGKRRNCDGDEDSIMLLLDALLNFSRQFLP
ncbi:MAG: DNA polymerase II large subunit, partial [Candidatus Aenigmarchaeota archaeon]|nr:DNA polymerase II large subunit [Candidatus Aenigmarchaeota archaeon]